MPRHARPSEWDAVDAWRDEQMAALRAAGFQSRPRRRRHARHPQWRAFVDVVAIGQFKLLRVFGRADRIGALKFAPVVDRGPLRAVDWLHVTSPAPLWLVERRIWERILVLHDEWSGNGCPVLRKRPRVA